MARFAHQQQAQRLPTGRGAWISGQGLRCGWEHPQLLAADGCLEESTEPATASLHTLPFGRSATGGRTSSRWWLSSCSRAGGGGRRHLCCHHPCPIHPAFRWMGCQGCQTRRRWPGACKKIARQWGRADMRLAAKCSSRQDGAAQRHQPRTSRTAQTCCDPGTGGSGGMQPLWQSGAAACSPVVELRTSLNKGCVQHLLSLHAGQHTSRLDESADVAASRAGPPPDGGQPPSLRCQQLHHSV